MYSTVPSILGGSHKLQYMNSQASEIRSSTQHTSPERVFA